MPSTRPHYAWTILAVSVPLVFCVIGLARFGYTLLLPPMQEALGLDNTQAGILASVDLVGYLGLALASGAFASRYGSRPVIVVGATCVGLGMVLTSLADGFWPAMAGRLLTGIGSGTANIPTMSLFAAWFARRRRGFAVGVAVCGSSLALVLLGQLGPVLLEEAAGDGWRLCWRVFAAMVFAVTLAAVFLLRDKPHHVGLDPLDHDPADVHPIAQTGGMQWGLVYRSGTMWRLGFVYAAFGYSYIVFLTFFTKYLLSEGGYTQTGAGRLFALLGVLSLGCGFSWGWLSDRVGRGPAMAMVYGLQAVAYGVFAWWTEPAGFLLGTVLFGLTAWSVPVIVTAACGDLLGPRLAPAGLGFATLFFGTAQALSPGVSGWLADVTGSLSLAYVVAAAVAVAGAIGAMTVAGEKPNGARDQKLQRTPA